MATQGEGMVGIGPMVVQPASLAQASRAWRVPITCPGSSEAPVDTQAETGDLQSSARSRRCPPELVVTARTTVPRSQAQRWEKYAPELWPPANTRALS